MGKQCSKPGKWAAHFLPRKCVFVGLHPLFVYMLNLKGKIRSFRIFALYNKQECQKQCLVQYPDSYPWRACDESPKMYMKTSI